jgi:hypothetical protein
MSDGSGAISASNVAGRSEKLHILPKSARFFWYGWTISIFVWNTRIKPNQIKFVECAVKEQLRTSLRLIRVHPLPPMHGSAIDGAALETTSACVRELV